VFKGDLFDFFVNESIHCLFCCYWR